MTRLGLAVVIGLATALAAPAGTRAAAPDESAQRALHAASVLVGSGCSGVLAEGTDLVFTAEHCLKGRQTIDLRFANGSTRTGYVAAVDEIADQAVLLLETPVAIEPLALARQAPISGTILYFEGSPRAPRFQEARLEHVGRCPSLPNLPNALFTTIRGEPGDSGAPLVDGAARVVGLVHGGAQCRIATPADTLARLAERALGEQPPQLTRGETPHVPTARACVR